MPSALSYRYYPHDDAVPSSGDHEELSDDPCGQDADLPEIPFFVPDRLAPGNAALLPDFLVISPPKTGSTWLATNLSCHPDLFVPSLKEIKYFSSYHRWLDLDWYAHQFADASGRLKGEASPSYALLPQRTIAQLHALMPQVKLVFLMRDPVARAWSHARHNHSYREANFVGHTGDLHDVSDDAWRANFRHPWPLLSGDYLGQLGRWLAVFPPEQIFVGCYEHLATDPVGLLQRVLTFLGVSAAVDWSAFRTQETILPGVEKPLPELLRRELRALWRDRTEETAAFLQDHFALSVRDVWGETLGSDTDGTTGAAVSAAAHAAAVFARGADDRYLAANLQTELDAALPQLIEEGHYGYNIVLHRGQFLVLWQGLGTLDLDGLNAATRELRPPQVFVTATLPEARDVIAQHVIRELQQQQALLESSLRERETQLAEYAAALERLVNSPSIRGLRTVKRCLRKWLGRSPAKSSPAKPADAQNGGLFS